MKTAAQIVHGWTRQAERTFPNPGKIADPETFTTDTDWPTGRPITDEFVRACTRESHRVIEGQRGVTLSPFGWYVVATLGGSIALLAVSLAMYSMRGMR